jgi:membrane protease YdiL (CAAX protease family)
MARANHAGKPGAQRAEEARDNAEPYWRISKRPIQMLVFLLPLVVYYEVAMLTILSIGDDGALTRTYTNQAHKALLVLFEEVGAEASGWYLPGAALVVVMLTWQVLAREPWRIAPRAMALMVVESLALTVPVLVLGQLAARLSPDLAAPPAFAPGDSGNAVAELSVAGRVAFSVGAGLYEELVFRMLVLGVLHTLLVDVGGMANRGGTAIAVAVSSLLFMAYHWVGADASTLSFAYSAFYLVSGLYFGLVFVARGFGIVVAVHAIYDVITSVFLID